MKKELAQKLLEIALSNGGDFAEIFEEKAYSGAYMCLNGKLEKANCGDKVGCGIRIYNGVNSVYCSTSDVSEEGLIKAVTDLASTVSSKEKVKVCPLEEVIVETKHPILIPLKSVSAQKKIALMKRVSKVMSEYDPCIEVVRVTYTDMVQDVTIYNSKGKMISDHRERTRLAMMPVAKDHELMQDAFAGPGAHQGFEFYDTFDVDDLARKTCQSAITMLHARECPSGEMTVIIDNGFGGVVFHEACGHSLEATSVSKGHSVFCDKIGKQIASSKVTAIDDGTIANAWGSANIDDEGNFCQKNILIKDGICTSYMVDTLNARRMNHPITGSSRRQNYHFEPTSRMTNTYIAAGDDDFDEMIASTKRGLYAKKMGGGSVHPVTGDFNFNVTEAYLIEDGKITEPVKGATLIGNGADVLMKIDRVSNNLAHGQGMCGSSSGSIPTNVGQPAIRISSCTVGGKGGKF